MPGRLLLCLLLLASSQIFSPACINMYNPNEAGTKASKTLVDKLTSHPFEKTWESRLDPLRVALNAGGDYKVKNDLAAVLIHTAGVAEAVELLKQIESEHPGLYMTASNLGTALELSGDDVEALKWIRKGIELNPDAHEQSEWIHARILEAKIAIASDPDWLKTHRVLGLSFKAPIGDTLPTGNRNEPLSIDAIKAALIYQLHERLEFTNADDLIVANLLVDLGQLVSLEKDTGAVGSAGVFELAIHYLGAQAIPGHKTLFPDWSMNHPIALEAQAGYVTAHASDRPEILPSPAPKILAFLVLSTLGVVLGMRTLRRNKRQLTPQ
jgi:hypothetical protein